jgi:hypothetical protein
MKLDKILVPLDGSVLAEAALWTAIDLAGEDGATLSLVRAAQVHARPTSGTGRPPRQSSRPHRSRRRT